MVAKHAAFFADIFQIAIFVSRLCAGSHARMAELVDALVSNTSGAIRAGSIPAPGTFQNANNLMGRLLAFFFGRFCQPNVNLIKKHLENWRLGGA